jgi:hypothetical protein
MSISPFSVRPASPEDERRRARLVVLIAALGIAATLLAYAISPGVRHVVGHAAHSVKGAVSHVLDHDQGRHTSTGHAVTPAVAPAQAKHGAPQTSSQASGAKGSTSSTAPAGGTPAPSP